MSDPFANTNPLWEPFDPIAASAQDSLTMPDTATSGLRSWLRSDEVTKALNRLRVPARPTPRPDQGRLPHIPGFPDRR
jgi:hypothetical protein